jgi:transposase InsO family protein
VEDRLAAVQLIREAVDSGARRVAAARTVGISMRTLQRWEAVAFPEDQRRGPHGVVGNALSEAERALVVAIATSAPFRDLPPSQIVPILADSGLYVASEATFYRVLREEKLLAHRGTARARSHSRPREYTADGPNQVWSWDLTYLRSPTRGSFYYLYLVVDVWSRKIVGWAVHERESPELAAELIQEAVEREGADGRRLVLHSDNGGPMKGATLLATLERLGIVASFSRPRVSDDNPYSEALFRTLKGRPEYPVSPFRSLEDARGWVEAFVDWYNEEHRHSAIQYVTPGQRHRGEHIAILTGRTEVYEEAKENNPRRWSGQVRDWQPVAEVVLNASASAQRPHELQRSA